MKRVVLAVAIATILAGTRLTLRQGGGNPFIDHSDTGETVHVLPPSAAIRSPRDTQSTFAGPRDQTAVYPPSYGSGNLINHGGPEIGKAGFWAVYWNSSVANSTATSTRTATHYTYLKDEIDDFIFNFPDNTNWDNSSTDDFEIIQQYGSSVLIANTLQKWGSYVDSQATQPSITDSKIRSYLAGLFNAGKLPADSSIIYGVYFPPGMKVLLSGGASCSTFCGYHGHFPYLGREISYAAFPYLNCSACKLSSLTVADMMTIVASHEIREAVTDPQLNAWYDAAGYEADDKCAWHNLYQMTKGGFWVQPEYSNGGTVTASGFTANYPGPGCIVPNK